MVLGYERNTLFFCASTSPGIPESQLVNLKENSSKPGSFPSHSLGRPRVCSEVIPIIQSFWNSSSLIFAVILQLGTWAHNPVKCSGLLASCPQFIFSLRFSSLGNTYHVILFSSAQLAWAQMATSDLCSRQPTSILSYNCFIHGNLKKCTAVLPSL